ncbi:hypothetical protein QTP70_001037 [Hemibagrus guttatus]|uniref:AT-rich interactive domain-containing protein 3 n=1 Tax=Hemibagrus guttatus TaxID=175788 RepID=A0AAE0RB41_9TELE|nr:hypothetical protein QTP70_001037 [Hemibagrus guttatus]
MQSDGAVYMKYLYPYECARKGLSSPSELQAAIDSNRREGRRPSYSSSLFHFSSSPSSAPHILSPPKMHLAALSAGAAAALSGLQAASVPSIKALEDTSPSLLARAPAMGLALGPQQVAGLARAATLEQLREKLETGTGLTGVSEGPERKMARLAEEQQRLMQQALQQNLLAMASHMPMNLRMGLTPKEDKHDLALSISSTGSSSISVSVEVNGVVYSGTLFAQKPASVAVSSAASTSSVTPNTAFTFPSHSPSSSSSKGPSSAEPSTSGQGKVALLLEDAVVALIAGETRTGFGVSPEQNVEALLSKEFIKLKRTVPLKSSCTKYNQRHTPCQEYL